MNHKGFSLTELIVVMGIIGILLGIVSLNFHDWQIKSQIEKQAREIYTDFNTARTESIFRKTRHSVIMNTDGTGYVMRRYSSPDEVTSAGMIINTKKTTYLLTKENGTNFGALEGIFMFDIRGTTNDLNTIRVNPTNSGATFDCVVIHTVRTNLGKMEGSACVQK